MYIYNIYVYIYIHIMCLPPVSTHFPPPLFSSLPPSALTLLSSMPIQPKHLALLETNGVDVSKILKQLSLHEVGMSLQNAAGEREEGAAKKH